MYTLNVVAEGIEFLFYVWEDPHFRSQSDQLLSLGFSWLCSILKS